MRVMLDTNVLVMSAVLSSSYINRMLDLLAEQHTIVLCTYVIDELKRITAEKFPDKSILIDEFLTRLPYELIYTPDKIDASKYPDIRDIKDLPVLVSAINDDVDVLITADKDFAPLDMKRPEILTPHAFVNKNDYS